MLQCGWEGNDRSEDKIRRTRAHFSLHEHFYMRSNDSDVMLLAKSNISDIMSRQVAMASDIM
jgi:hypothetical protein